MRLTLFISAVFTSTILCGQTIPSLDTTKTIDTTKTADFPLEITHIKLDTFTEDTLHLTSFITKKIVSYQLNGLTFHVDYTDFTKMLKGFWKTYKEGQKYIAKDKKRALTDSSYKNYGEIWKGSDERWQVISSTYNLLKAQRKTIDTIHLSHDTFSSVGFGTWNNFFPFLIEHNRCAITDKKGKLHQTIIRQKGSWYRGPLSAWGGRRYFLVGQTEFFLEGTDWIS